jgi:glyoxylase-like metal-dependent hydrolase (beta-lactamase superfamily II)
MSSPLRADTYVAPGGPVTPRLPLPESVPAIWSPTSSTLIHGATEALLTDPLLTKQQGTDLAIWIKSVIPNKTLTTIFITHGHPDHYLGLSTLLPHFPSARVVATSKVHAQIQKSLDPASLNAFWHPLYPDQLSAPSSPFHALEAANIITLDGHVLTAYDAGNTDTSDTSFLHIPSLSMVVAGDIVYNSVHQWFGEANTTQRRNDWKAALDQISALKPEIIIAGHKRIGAVDGFNNIAETKAYIDAFEECVSQNKDAKSLFESMMKRYPERVNPFILWMGCQTQYQTS